MIDQGRVFFWLGSLL